MWSMLLERMRDMSGFQIFLISTVAIFLLIVFLILATHIVSLLPAEIRIVFGFLIVSVVWGQYLRPYIFVRSGDCDG